MRPLTWEVLHRDAGLAPAPFPDRLTRPPEEGWGTPLRILRKQRASALTPLFTQLARHLERSGVQLDAATLRAVELRLGRPLELVPAR